MKRWLGSALVLMMALLSFGPALPAEETPEKAAQAAAQAWLATVDSGKYGESWDAAAALFRQAVTRSQWEEALGKVRAPLGKLVSRKVRLAEYAKTLPNAPAGEYVVILYDTSFEKMSAATEKVTPMKEKDGSWKVSGYYIQ